VGNQLGNMLIEEIKEIYGVNPDNISIGKVGKLEFIASKKLQTIEIHHSASGSEYITIAEKIKIRIANHEQISSKHDKPDYNLVNKGISLDIIREIEEKIDYPELVSQQVFSWHVGVTIPKLKKVLSAECYEDVCENPNYPNTFRKCIKTKMALKEIKAIGYNETIPVLMKILSFEDYNGELF
jgi:hypothetical protein